MDFPLHTAVTAALITVLILGSQRLSEHAAGVLSGLPFTTVPALLVVGGEQGAAAAADLAAGGIVGCALAALFAVAYHLASRRLAPIPTLLTGLAALAVGTGLACGTRLGTGLAIFIAFATCAGALASVRPVITSRPPARVAEARSSARRGALSALVTGVVSAAVALAVGGLSPVLAGTIATLPMIGVATVSMRHMTIGPGAVAPYLRGYIESSMARAAFCAIFAGCAVPLGITVALVAALALSVGGLVYSTTAMRPARS